VWVCEFAQVSLHIRVCVCVNEKINLAKGLC